MIYLKTEALECDILFSCLQLCMLKAECDHTFTQCEYKCCFCPSVKTHVCPLQPRSLPMKSRMISWPRKPWRSQSGTMTWA